MKEVERVMYQGRAVPKDAFRVFVYGKDKAMKLMNSWDEYSKAIASGLWFANKDDIDNKPKLQRVRLKRVEKPVVEEVIKDD